MADDIVVVRGPYEKYGGTVIDYAKGLTSASGVVLNLLFLFDKGIVPLEAGYWAQANWLERLDKPDLTVEELEKLVASANHDFRPTHP